MKRFALAFAPFFGAALLASACNDTALVPEPGTPPPPPTSPTVAPSPTPLPSPPAPADFNIAVWWDDLGLDWELHLVKPSGRINDNATDCTWTSCVGHSPDWGAVGDPVDDPHKDYDNTGEYGPERIWMADPEVGTYTVLVEHWGAGQSGSSGYVTVDIDGTVTTVSMNGLAPQHVWTVATIEWPSGVVTPSQAVFDCSASWSSGCTAPLP